MAESKIVQQLDNGRNEIQPLAFVIAAGICVLLSVCFAFSALRGGTKQLCEIQLGEKINPNVAPVASLLRLPGIGIGRAKAIAAYREDFAKSGKAGQPFENSDDLQKVKGIGPETAKDIREWLTFE